MKDSSALNSCLPLKFRIVWSEYLLLTLERRRHIGSTRLSSSLTSAMFYETIECCYDLLKNFTANISNTCQSILGFYLTRL